MGRSAKKKNRPAPVEHIELNEERVPQRLIASAVLLLVGAALLAFAVKNMFTPDVGWQDIEVSTSMGATCGEDFTLFYDVRTSAEAKELTSLYSESCRKAFELFHSDMEFEDVINVATVNLHPNEVLEVDAALYEAFSVVVDSGRRELYLGPIYDRYEDLFYAEDDAQLVDFDPRLSEDVREEYAGVLVYANDPQAIALELLGGNRVRLNVSDACLAWAQQEGISKFIDFSWMRNAFIADYLAGELTGGGYTKGILNSYDGFTRNLDSRDVDYTYPLHHRRDDGVYPPADLHYYGPMSLVQMRDYPVSALDRPQYYQLRNGEIRTLYLDTADALCKSAVDTLVCYSREKGCAQLLLEIIPIYIADNFQEEALTALAREGIWSIYCQDWEVRHTEPEPVLSDLLDDGTVRYVLQQIGS